tara:strand:- start:292 stop:828 length:537 start_codon:yes stop_codon:yes gene_type:complete
MRAKITKTVDIGDIPSESRKMIDQAKNILVYYMPEKMSEIVRHSLSSNAEEYFHAIELIKLFRQHLNGYDENLQEIENIMLGYKEYIYSEADKQKQNEYQEQEVQPAHSNVPDESAIENLKKKQAADQEMRDKIDSFLSEAGLGDKIYDEEWLAQEEAETEKRQAQQMGADEVENEEG